jgi:hypothetical protein
VAESGIWRRGGSTGSGGEGGQTATGGGRGRPMGPAEERPLVGPGKASIRWASADTFDFN